MLLFLSQSIGSTDLLGSSVPGCTGSSVCSERTCSAEGEVFQTVRILCSLNSDCYKCSIKERCLITECSEQRWSIHQHLSQMEVWGRNEKEKSRHKYYCSLLILKQCHCSESSHLLMKNPLISRFRLEGKFECLTLIKMSGVDNWC